MTARVARALRALGWLLGRVAERLAPSMPPGGQEPSTGAPRPGASPCETEDPRVAWGESGRAFAMLALRPPAPVPRPEPELREGEGERRRVLEGRLRRLRQRAGY